LFLAGFFQPSLWARASTRLLKLVNYSRKKFYKMGT
jgi:hypothetical protein